MRLVLVGCGGQAGGDVPEIASHPAVKIVAVVDPDARHRDAFGDRYKVPAESRYADYREMYDKTEGQIDAVYIATPDHMHAPVGLAALERGLHVYQQKPLARGVGEVRALAKAAARHRRAVTQMGIQIHGNEAYRTAVAWARAGVIGRVKEVHTMCGKGWGGAVPAHRPDPIPRYLDWELYCGVTPTVPFVEGYFHPGNWRKWQAFGTGTLGDMACHILDPVFGGLELRVPRSVVSHLEGPPNDVNYPYNAHIEWVMAGTPRTTPTLTLHWYHGDTRPPAGLIPGSEAPGTGSVWIGETGIMVLPHWSIPTVFDLKGNEREDLPKKEASVNHYHEWVDVAERRRPGPTGAHFAFAAALTETVLLGNVASWQQGKVLNFDARRCHFVGDGAREANQRLLPRYRDDFTIRF